MDTIAIAIPPKEAAFEIVFAALKEKGFTGYNAHIRAVQLVDAIITPSILQHPNDIDDIDDIVYALNKLKEHLINKP